MKVLKKERTWWVPATGIRMWALETSAKRIVMGCGSEMQRGQVISGK